MPALLQQFGYQYELDKVASAESSLDNSNGSSLQQQFREQRKEREDLQSSLVPERDHAAQQRENILHLQQHEREQHLQQLQAINNLLLDMPTPPSPTSYPNPKFLQDMASPPTKGPSANRDDMSICDLFGLELPRGSLMGAGQKGAEQGGQTNLDNPSYRNYYQQDDNSNGYYSNLNNNMETPSSPISVYTPTSPSTPGSLYSNPYSYSSVNSSPYSTTSSSSSNYNKYASSPSSNHKYPASPSDPSYRTSSYGRPIRGSPPYSDCSSPSVEFPPHVFGGNGSRSNSPADSDTSIQNNDSPLSDIMSYLSINSGQHQCYSPNSNSFPPQRHFENGRTSSDAHKLKNYLYNSHQQQSQPQSPQSPQSPHYFHHHHHNHERPRNHYNHYNQQQNNHYVNSSVSSEKDCCLSSPRSMSINIVPNSPSHTSLDKAARYHRNAAAASDANYTWSGTLPKRTQKPVGYSSKVFLGGVPWDITESILISTFKQFGQIGIEWPTNADEATSQRKGYVYIIFESEKQVKALLSCCTHDFSNGGSYYYKISSKRMKGKDVQVIPWALNESNYVKSSSQKLDPEKTVFVGALHGMMTASGLATVMNDLFDNVIYAGIDTDKFKYPIGSARVTFSSKYSFNKAINAAFVEIKTTKFTKKVQVDPYIEDSPCSSCLVQQGPYFCRETVCFKYYCHTCWQWAHNNITKYWHIPMSRGLKNKQVIGLTPRMARNRLL